MEIVGQPHHVVGVDGDAVRAADHALAPRAQEVAVAVEDDDRVLAPVEHERSILLVHRHARHLVIGPAVRQLAPALDDRELHLFSSMAWAMRSKRRLSGVRPSSWLMT